MFEVPDAKRVRREDLETSSADEESVHDEEYAASLRAQLEAQLGSTLDLEAFDFSVSHHGKPPPLPSTNSAGGEGVDETEDADEAFEFRLFTTQKSAAKVIINQDDPLENAAGGIVGPGRPLSFYCVRPATGEQKEQFEAAAVTGEDVITRSAQRWWGMEMPWRAVSIPPAPILSSIKGSSVKLNGTENKTEQIDGLEGKRKRPGKKRRIAVRTKLRAQLEKEAELKKKQEEAEKLKAQKEEQVLNKKKRSNRQKKLRRRAKDKEKKVAAKGEDESTAEEALT